MLKINRDIQAFSLLETPTLADASITERYDLQEFISNGPTAFFSEIGQDLFLLGKEIQPSSNVQDRIDLLAVDREGTCVIVELKRGKHKLHMFQAISYAGMISDWTAEDFFQLLSKEQQESLVDFLEVDVDDINRKQRIVLIAEDYDYSLLIGAEWLSSQFGVDVTCCRIAVARDTTTGGEYLVCSNVFPAPELTKEASSRGRKPVDMIKTKWSDWESALLSVTNDAVIKHFRQSLTNNQESYLAKRILRYRNNGKRRWFMAARNKLAYVWQQGRFEHDVEFWQQRMSAPGDVKPVKSGECLRMFLVTDGDFNSFRNATSTELSSVEWQGSLGDENDELEASE